MAKAVAKKKPLSKSQLIGAISDETEMTRRDVSSVLEALSSQIERSLGRRGPGAFTLPGLVKIEKRRVPARKARKGVPNPFRHTVKIGFGIPAAGVVKIEVYDVAGRRLIRGRPWRCLRRLSRWGWLVHVLVFFHRVFSFFRR